jgi:hypothetical protein
MDPGTLLPPAAPRHAIPSDVMKRQRSRSRGIPAIKDARKVLKGELLIDLDLDAHNRHIAMIRADSQNQPLPS